MSKEENKTFMKCLNYCNDHENEIIEDMVLYLHRNNLNTEDFKKTYDKTIDDDDFKEEFILEHLGKLIPLTIDS